MASLAFASGLGWGGPCAWAGEWHLQLALVPLATINSKYPDVYSGLGYDVNLAGHLMPELAIWAEGRLHGNGSWLSAGARYFVWGSPNPPALAEGKAILINVRSLGLYFDAGAAYFLASEPLVPTGTLSFSGLGLEGSLGFQFPLFGRFSADLKAGTLNTLDAPFTTYFGAVGLDVGF